MSEAVKIHRADPQKKAITLSDSALAHVQQKIKQRGAGIGLRLGVKKTGCSGLAYVVDYVDQANDDDLTFPVNAQLSIYVDNMSFPYLQGTHVDFVKQGLSERFVFQNPNEAAACGCGESFTVE